MASITPESLIERSTVTVLSFVPDPTDRYQNTRTGEIHHSGLLSLSCGHSYVAYPHGLADHSQMPAAGEETLCATCIQSILAEAAAARQAQS